MSQDTGGDQKNTKQTVCWNCGLVCKNRQGLSVHQNKCLNSAAKGASFFQNGRIDLNFLPARKQNSTDDKLLPASHPLTEVPSQQQQQSQSHLESRSTVHQSKCPSSALINVQQQQSEVRTPNEETLQRCLVSSSEQSNDNMLRTIMSSYDIIVKVATKSLRIT